MNSDFTIGIVNVAQGQVRQDDGQVLASVRRLKKSGPGLLCGGTRDIDVILVAPGNQSTNFVAFGQRCSFVLNHVNVRYYFIECNFISVYIPFTSQR